MNILEIIFLIGFCVFLGYCCMDDRKTSQQVSQQWQVDFETFYSWFAHEILLPLLQKMARAVDADIVYPNTVYDIMPTVVVNVPQSRDGITLVYEVELHQNLHVTLAQLEKFLTRKLRKALSQRLQIPVNSPDMKSVVVKLFPNSSGSYTMTIEMNTAITNAICDAIQAFYTHQQYRVVQTVQQAQQSKLPPTP